MGQHHIRRPSIKSAPGHSTFPTSWAGSYFSTPFPSYSFIRMSGKNTPPHVNKPSVVTCVARLVWFIMELYYSYVVVAIHQIRTRYITSSRIYTYHSHIEFCAVVSWYFLKPFVASTMNYRLHASTIKIICNKDTHLIYPVTKLFWINSE